MVLYINVMYPFGNIPLKIVVAYLKYSETKRRAWRRFLWLLTEARAEAVAGSGPAAWGGGRGGGHGGQAEGAVCCGGLEPGQERWRGGGGGGGGDDGQ